MKSPSPAYDHLKRQVELAKTGDARALRFIRILCQEVCSDDDPAPAWAIIDLGECLLRIREKDVLVS